MASKCYYPRYVLIFIVVAISYYSHSENILFNLPYIEERYQKTLEVSTNLPFSLQYPD